MPYPRPFLLVFLCAFAPLWAEAQSPSPFSVLPASNQPFNVCRANASDTANTDTVGNPSCTPAPAVKKLPIRIVPFRDPNQPATRPDALTNASSAGPAGAQLTYNGGPVISNVQVVVVYWGNNVDPVVTNGITGFYQTVVDSTYLDLMYEYSTVGVNYNGTTTNQNIGHGTVLGPYTITPSVTSGTIDDSAIQTELQKQIAASHLPPVSTDASGQSNTLYTVYFPPGMNITTGGTNSCQAGGFCAYHGSSKTTGTSQQIFQYSVVPDFGSGSGCDSGCGGGTEFQNITSVSSHELAESITDAQVAFAGPGNGPPLAWYDNTNGEIGDICNQYEDTVSAHGKTFTIQQLWSNNQGACVNGPGASLSLTTTASSVPTGTPLSVTVTVKNSKGVTLPFYTGTIHFTSTDAAAQLPADYAFTASDGGTHTFSVSFGTTGSQSVAATDVDVSSIKGSVSETVTQGQQTPVITWATPAPITYGTPLGPAQLDAMANVPGTFAYTPVAGTVLSAGLQQLQVVFTPNDTTKYKTTTASVMLQVNQATPSITWATPAPITYGTALSTAQLNATSTVQGKFVYNPALGTVLSAGAQTLKVIFTPTDSTDYTTAFSSVTLQVNQATPTITWVTPTPITYGTPLGAAQLNATANVPGSFSYTPAEGTVLPAGAQTLKAVFTPSDTTNYTSASASVILQVTDFAIAASPSSQTIPSGQDATYSLALTSLGGFNGTVALSCSGGPPNSSCTLSPASVRLNGSNNAAMTVELHPPMNVNHGTFMLTITAQSGNDVHTVPVSLTVK
ncbi:MAG: hypothetical protein JO108_33390 [Acidobacteriaceae bacterium]|nr:hypothetical protein [Acidobacteriaceae bacterium]